MKRFVAMGLAMMAGLFLMVPQHAQAFSCWRHIYNNSACGWTFQDTGGGAGNAYFIDGGGCTSNCTEKKWPMHRQPALHDRAAIHVFVERHERHHERDAGLDHRGISLRGSRPE